MSGRRVVAGIHMPSTVLSLGVTVTGGSHLTFSSVTALRAGKGRSIVRYGCKASKPRSGSSTPIIGCVRLVYKSSSVNAAITQARRIYS